MDTSTIPVESDDALFDLEQRIARRADEFARKSGFDRTPTLMHWLEAERQVWQEIEGQVYAVR